jgi:thiamine biosynthesis protein ThiS
VKVIVNGEPKECAEGASLAQFVESLGLKGDRIAVELNREIANRKRWNEIPLREGDRLEIVHFVGGGSRDSAIV